MSRKKMSRGTFENLDLKRWRSLPHEEKVAEFNALIDCPYWYFLPEELRSRIRNLVFH